VNRRSLFWKVYPYYFVIVAISLVLTALYASREMRRMYINEMEGTLEMHARLVDRQLRQLLLKSDISSLDRLCKEFGELSDTRITVVDAEGVVLGDSDEDPQTMENHGVRPEIMQAYAGQAGAATRYSNTLQMTMMYVAVPIMEKGEIVGVVRTSLPVSAIENTLGAFYYNVAITGVLIILLAAVISIIVFRRLTCPIEELQKGAEQFAMGNLKLKLPIADTKEIATLANSMNRMAEQLDARIRTIVEQRNEREAVFSSMSEGILALDAKERIVALNQAAADILAMNIEESPGKSIHDVVRIAALYDFIGKAFNDPGTVETEITLPGETERCLQAHGTALKDTSGSRVGVVLVFNDITRLKKLENIRRHFVANVSHELKTPITAITGSAETLLDGALENHEDSRRFLKMIIRHSDRLNNLIEDLLSLSRLESESERGDIKLSRSRITDILESAVQACHDKNIARKITITCSCDSSLEADINPLQLEQAVINLVDNAVKNSSPGTTVYIDTAISNDEIVIAVRDEGCGIERKHLPRLFERFYRVDKARSHEAGGTGLGLAIVKHIALSHGGRVSVESTPGKGSTFRIHIPVQR
jgi:two-component system phosphate regulon sensor histidine kinase PhoR